MQLQPPHEVHKAPGVPSFTEAVQTGSLPLPPPVALAQTGCARKIETHIAARSKFAFVRTLFFIGFPLGLTNKNHPLD
jgi:hypothetical protein